MEGQTTQTRKNKRTNSGLQNPKQNPKD